MTLRVLFLHGLESSPAGSKVQRLRANASYEVTAPELPTRAVVEQIQSGSPIDIGPALAVASAALEQCRPDVVIGSSFGGGVASRLAYEGPLVLLAPAATKLFGVASLPVRSGRVVIVHGRNDEVVPMEHSVQLAARSTCDVHLWLVDDDHRLKKSVAAGVLDEAIAIATRT